MLKDTPSPSARRTMHPVSKGILACALFYGLTVFTHTWWLPFFANFLIIENEPQKASLILASTGSYGRVREAVRLLREDYGGMLLIVGDRRIATPIPNKSPLDLAEDEITGEGIPREKLRFDHSTSTIDDARIARAVMSANNHRSLLVVTDLYNMRRVSLIFGKIFRGAGARVYYVPAAAEKSKLHPDRWWQYQKEFNYVIKEWVKLSMDLWRPA